VAQPPLRPDEPDPQGDGPAGPASDDGDDDDELPWTPSVDPGDPVPRARHVARGSYVEAATGESYASLIAGELAAEESHTRSLQSRSLAIVASSGVTAALLFTTTMGFITSPRFGYVGTARTLLTVALVGLAIAVLLGLVGYSPARPRIEAERLAEIQARFPTAAGMAIITDLRLATLTVARKINRRNMLVLLAAFFLEAFAIVNLCAAAIDILNGR
jgi:hypothetical protein